VTLARAWDPAGRPDDGSHIEFDVALDSQGYPDRRMWLEDPSPWSARRLRRDGTALRGDVAYDEDGWALRFFTGDTPDPDAPAYRLRHLAGALRPGEVLTLRAPDGEETTWRVVGVRPPTA
jgi:hypothetical protein